MGYMVEGRKTAPELVQPFFQGESGLAGRGMRVSGGTWGLVEEELAGEGD